MFLLALHVTKTIQGRLSQVKSLDGRADIKVPHSCTRCTLHLVLASCSTLNVPSLRRKGEDGVFFLALSISSKNTEPLL